MNLVGNIDKLQTGSEAEFRRFYEANFAYFQSFALGFIKSDEVCRDLVQDVFIAYWEKHADFSDSISLKVYFYRSIRNKCLNELRKIKNTDTEAEQEIQKLASEDYLLEAIIEEEIAASVHQKIAGLPEQAQKILKLSLTGKNNKEIAELLEISVNTVKTHKFKAYSVLRNQLRDLQFILQIISVG